MARKIVQATIPEPYEDVKSLYRAVLAMKELVEVLAGQRGTNRDGEAVTFGELPAYGAGDTAWKTLPYINGWADYGLPYSPCGYRKLSSGLVIMRGLTQGGSAAQICVLPPGYRPGIQMLYIAETSPNVQCRMDLQTDGVLYHTGGSNGWISLSNICFFAEY
jgi:hypothetical protein